jgi:hypothetical protein
MASEFLGMGRKNDCDALEMLGECLALHHTEFRELVHPTRLEGATVTYL